MREDLASHMERYSWELAIDEYDEELNQLAATIRPLSGQ